MMYWWLPLEIAGILLFLMAGVKLIEWAGRDPRLMGRLAPSKPRASPEGAPSKLQTSSEGVKPTPQPKKQKAPKIIEG